MVMASSSRRQNALKFLIREAQKAGTVISNAVLGKPKRRSKPRYVKGIKNGQFFRYKVKDDKPPPARSMPKLPPLGPQTIPQPLKNVPPKPPSLPPPASASSPNHQEPQRTAAETIMSSRAMEWLKQNMAVLILNFGSICTFTGFTRSDVLELRSLSMTGSICSVMYFLSMRPLRWTPIAWSSVFASINGYKISQIWIERKGKVILSEQEEDIFVEHFMPHGVTPKQFEKLSHKAKRVKFKNGDLIIRHGDPLQHVYLVIKGTTRASFLGRRLSAVSSAPGHRQNKKGGDSGAWIGEMAFLEAFAEKELASNTEKNKAILMERKKRHLEIEKNEDGDGDGKNKEDKALSGVEKESKIKQPEDDLGEVDPPFVGRVTGTAAFTVVATHDVEVLRWSHEDIEALMQKSSDMRASLTRAMTAPIVGKVINFTVSAKSKRPTWSTWLDDWKQSGATVNIIRDQQVMTEDDGDDDDEDTEGINVEPKVVS